MSRKNIIPLESEKNTLSIQWLSGKYCNFTKDKIYEAHPQARRIKNGPYHDFRITDDEGDLYSLDKRDLGRKYRIIDKNPQKTTKNSVRKTVMKENESFGCPVCGYQWKHPYELDFDEQERVPCCPECKTLIEDGGDE